MTSRCSLSGHMVWRMWLGLAKSCNFPDSTVSSIQTSQGLFPTLSLGWLLKALPTRQGEVRPSSSPTLHTVAGKPVFATMGRRSAGGAGPVSAWLPGQEHRTGRHTIQQQSLPTSLVPRASGEISSTSGEISSASC